MVFFSVLEYRSLICDALTVRYYTYLLDYLKIPIWGIPVPPYHLAGAYFCFYFKYRQFVSCPRSCFALMFIVVLLEIKVRNFSFRALLSQISRVLLNCALFIFYWNPSFLVFLGFWVKNLSMWCFNFWCKLKFSVMSDNSIFFSTFSEFQGTVLFGNNFLGFFVLFFCGLSVYFSVFGRGFQLEMEPCNTIYSTSFRLLFSVFK